MDVKYRQAFARIDIKGVKEPILLNDGNGLAMLLGREVVMALAKAKSIYQGVTIEIAFEPINETLTSFEKAQKEIWAGLDLSNVEMASEEDELLYAGGNPSDPKSHIYDPIYAEYIACISSKYRETKTPEDLVTIRKHVEAKYQGTSWWNGSHRW